MNPEPQKIYDSLPAIECKGKYQQSCGPIGLFPAEISNLRSKGLSVPTVCPSPQWGELSCSALNSKGHCTIYSDRPLICRLFGLVKRLRCPHRCKPSRWMSDKEAAELMKRVHTLQPGSPHLTINPPPKLPIEL